MFSADFPLWLSYSIIVFAVFLIGISKAGFGGGVGLLSTPLMSLVLPAKVTVGFLLPLLIVADVFTIYHHWGHWDWRNLKILSLGAAVGILLGVVFIDRISDAQLKQLIGFGVIAFTLFQIIRGKIRGSESHYHPGFLQGTTVGASAGFVSAIAHSAGAIIAMHLLPQNLDKRTFVSTMVLFFAAVNLFKVIPYFSIGILSWETIKAGLIFLPIIPVGTMAGAWLNKRIDQASFTKIIYILVFITGVQLLSGKNFLYLFVH